MTNDLTARHQLVAILREAGVLDHPEWEAAFTEIARDVFAPAFWHTLPGGDLEWLDRTDPDHFDRWLDVVYSDDSLVTQLREDGTASSSSTQPSLTAQLLRALDLRDGHRVLEIGTGTGYNAALLCHRLGADKVTSIDIDPELVDAAGVALASIGYTPTLVAGDGLAGVPQGAPYDRVVSTCSTNRVPPAWIEQCAPGGVVLANVGLGVVRLQVDDTGTSAHGLALPDSAGFIEARSADAPVRLTVADVMALSVTTERTFPGSVTTDYEDPDFLSWLYLCVPNLTRLVITFDDFDPLPVCRTRLIVDRRDPHPRPTRPGRAGRPAGFVEADQ